MCSSMTAIPPNGSDMAGLHKNLLLVSENFH